MSSQRNRCVENESKDVNGAEHLQFETAVALLQPCSMT